MFADGTDQFAFGSKVMVNFTLRSPQCSGDVVNRGLIHPMGGKGSGRRIQYARLGCFCTKAHVLACWAVAFAALVNVMIVEFIAPIPLGLEALPDWARWRTPSRIAANRKKENAI